MQRRPKGSPNSRPSADDGDGQPVPAQGPSSDSGSQPDSSSSQVAAMQGAAVWSAALLLIAIAAGALVLQQQPDQRGSQQADSSRHRTTTDRIDTDRFAASLQPPYYSVIFTSQRLTGTDELGYAAAAARMVELATEQPGFLGVESARGPDGLGITVSYWRSAADIAAWRRHLQHEHIRDAGRARWYSHYALRVAKVERAYAWDAAADGAAAPQAAHDGWLQQDTA